jgi:hypothetical protein
MEHQDEKWNQTEHVIGEPSRFSLDAIEKLRRVGCAAMSGSDPVEFEMETGICKKEKGYFVSPLYQCESRQQLKKAFTYEKVLQLLLLWEKTEKGGSRVSDTTRDGRVEWKPPPCWNCCCLTAVNLAMVQ